MRRLTLRRTPLRRGTPLARTALAKPRKAIRVRSARMEAAYAGPTGRRAFNRTLPPECAINSPVCWGGARTWHEVIKRSHGGAIVPGEKATAQGQRFVAACHPCNGYLEDHPAWAREKGFA